MDFRIKKSIICQNIGDYTVNEVLSNNYIPKAGDVGIFRVKEIGKHTRIQGSDRRNHHLYPNDCILAAFGTRYASSQIEGYLPTQIHDEYHILGQGGVVGVMKSIHKKYELKGPTTLELIGYAVDNNNEVINTKYYQQQEFTFNQQIPNNAQTILSIGGSMDSGKTTTAGFLSRGLKKAGNKVAFIKLTGTVYSKDTDFVYDCGADYATDFSVMGFPSTFQCELAELLNLYQSLLDEVAIIQPDYIVIEIADGLFQRETAMLLKNSAFMQTIDQVIYSDSNSTGVFSGLNSLANLNIQPFAVCGSFTASPLLIEEVQALTNTPIVDLEILSNTTVMQYLSKTDEINSQSTLRQAV